MPGKRKLNKPPYYGPFQCEDILVHVMRHINDIRSFYRFLCVFKESNRVWKRYHNNPIYFPRHQTSNRLLKVYLIPECVYLWYNVTRTYTHFEELVDMRFDGVNRTLIYEYALSCDMIDLLSELSFSPNRNIRTEVRNNRLAQIEIENDKKILYPDENTIVYDFASGNRKVIKKDIEKQKWCATPYIRMEKGKWVKHGLEQEYEEEYRRVTESKLVAYRKGKQIGSPTAENKSATIYYSTNSGGIFVKNLKRFL